MFNSILNVNSRDCRPECRPKSFGEVHDNYNWIECPSAKNPDKTYFFNVRSHCTTWTRPVPEHVGLPFFNPHAAPPEKSDEYESSPPVSDLDDGLYEDDQDDSYCEKKNAEKNFIDIASKLFYHGSRYDRKFRRGALKNIPEDDSEAHETLPVTHFLEFDYLSEDSSKRVRSPSSSSSESNQDSTDEGSKDFSDESCQCSVCRVPNEDSENTSSKCGSSTFNQSVASGYSVPRLKPVTFADLVTEPRKKFKRRKKRKTETTENEKIKLTPDKRVYDMYGIRTINYDPIFEFINPNFPMGVEPSCLTDSSIISTISEKKTLSNISFRIQDPVLSESSSGSSTDEPKEPNIPKNIFKPPTKSYKDILEGKELYIKLERIDVDKEYIKLKAAKEVRKNKDVLDSEWEEVYSENDDSKDETFTPGKNSEQLTGEEYTNEELSSDTELSDKNMKDEWFIVKNSQPTKLSLRKVASSNSAINSDETEVESNSMSKTDPKISTTENLIVDNDLSKPLQETPLKISLGIEYTPTNIERENSVNNIDESSINCQEFANENGLSPPVLKLRLSKEVNLLSDFEEAESLKENSLKENFNNFTSDSDDSTDATSDDENSMESAEDDSTTDYEGGEIQENYLQKNAKKSLQRKALENYESTFFKKIDHINLTNEKLIENSLMDCQVPGTREESFQKSDLGNSSEEKIVEDSTTNFKRNEIPEESLQKEVFENTIADENYWLEFFQKIDIENLDDEKIIEESSMDFDGSETPAEFFLVNDFGKLTAENIAAGGLAKEKSFQKKTLVGSIALDNIDEFSMDRKEENVTREHSFETNDTSCIPFSRKLIVREGTTSFINCIQEKIQEDTFLKETSDKLSTESNNSSISVQKRDLQNSMLAREKSIERKDPQIILSEPTNSTKSLHVIASMNSTAQHCINGTPMNCEENATRVNSPETFKNSFKLSARTLLCAEMVTSFINFEEPNTREESFEREDLQTSTAVNKNKSLMIVKKEVDISFTDSKETNNREKSFQEENGQTSSAMDKLESTMDRVQNVDKKNSFETYEYSCTSSLRKLITEFADSLTDFKDTNTEEESLQENEQSSTVVDQIETPMDCEESVDRLNYFEVYDVNLIPSPKKMIKEDDSFHENDKQISAAVGESNSLIVCEEKAIRKDLFGTCEDSCSRSPRKLLKKFANSLTDSIETNTVRDSFQEKNVQTSTAGDKIAILMDCEENSTRVSYFEVYKDSLIQSSRNLITDVVTSLSDSKEINTQESVHEKDEQSSTLKSYEDSCPSSLKKLLVTFSKSLTDFKNTNIEEKSLRKDEQTLAAVGQMKTPMDFEENVDNVNSVEDSDSLIQSSKKLITNVADSFTDFKEINTQESNRQKDDQTLAAVDEIESLMDCEENATSVNLLECYENSLTPLSSKLIKEVSVDEKNLLIVCENNEIGVNSFETYVDSLKPFHKKLIKEVNSSLTDLEETNSRKGSFHEKDEQATAAVDKSNSLIACGENAIRVDSFETHENSLIPSLKNLRTEVTFFMTDSKEANAREESFHRKDEPSFTVLDKSELLMDRHENAARVNSIDTTVVNLFPDSNEEKIQQNSLQKQLPNNSLFDSDDATEELEPTSQSSSSMNLSLIDFERDKFQVLEKLQTIFIEEDIEQKYLRRIDRDSDCTSTESLHSKVSKDSADENSFKEFSSLKDCENRNSTEKTMSSEVSTFFENVVSSSPVQNYYKPFKNENEDTSETETCSTVALSISRREDETDLELTDIEEQDFLENNNFVSNEEFQPDESIDNLSDTTHVYSDLDSN